MQALPKRFLIRYFIASFVMIGLSYLVFFVLFPALYYPAYPAVFLFIWAITLAVHLILVKHTEKNAKAFHSAFMMAHTFKLFVYLIFIGLYLYFEQARPISFVLSFLVLYLVFTFIEVQDLTQANKNKQNS